MKNTLRTRFLLALLALLLGVATLAPPQVLANETMLPIRTQLSTDEFSMFEYLGADQIGTYTSDDAAALTRNGAGDYSLNKTADGAETHYFVASAPMFRSNESGKGSKLTTITWGYELGVADATSIDVLCHAVTYANATDPSQAAHGGTIVDASYDSAHDTAAERADKDVDDEHVLTVTLPSSAYANTDNVLILTDLTAVLANTGTLKVRYVKFGYTAELPNKSN